MVVWRRDHPRDHFQQGLLPRLGGQTAGHLRYRSSRAIASSRRCRRPPGISGSCRSNMGAAFRAESGVRQTDGRTAHDHARLRGNGLQQPCSKRCCRQRHHPDQRRQPASSGEGLSEPRRSTAAAVRSRRATRPRDSQGRRPVPGENLRRCRPWPGGAGLDIAVSQDAKRSRRSKGSTEIERVARLGAANTIARWPSDEVSCHSRAVRECELPGRARQLRVCDRGWPAATRFRLPAQGKRRHRR